MATSSNTTSLPSTLGFQARILATLRDTVSALGHHLKHNLSSPRPWSEFFDYSAFLQDSTPSNRDKTTTMSIIPNRVHQNLTYFFSNYVAILIIILHFVLFNSILNFITLFILLKAWFLCNYYLDQLLDDDDDDDLVDRYSVNFRTFVTFMFISCTLMIVLDKISFGVLLLSLCKGVILVLIHATLLRVPEDRYDYFQDSSAKFKKDC